MTEGWSQPLHPRAPDGHAVCDRCGSEFIYWSSGEAEDVSNKVAAAMGRIVCPDCINEFAPKQQMPPPPNHDDQH